MSATRTSTGRAVRSGRVALADIAVTWDLPDGEMHAWLGEHGTVVLFPMPGRWRLIADPGISAASERVGPTLDEVKELLAERVTVPLVVSDPRWLAVFAINRRLASTQRLGARVFLLGDAAHIHSPTGGQGMNTGMQDAYNLAWKLALVLAGRAPDRLLYSFQAERRPIIEGMLHATDAASKVATPRGLGGARA